MSNYSYGLHTFDHIVIGAGIEGSSTAYRLAKRNNRVLLLEQFSLPHSRGSSHGKSRITRYGYTEEHYMVMMPENFRCWKVLEEEVGKKLYVKTGLLHVQDRLGKDISIVRELMVRKKLEFYDITATEACTKWPALQYNSNYTLIEDVDAGVLRADSCLQAFQQMFVEFGGVLKDSEQVLEIVPGTMVNIITNRGNYKAKSVVVTPGPWATKMLHPLGINIPLKVNRINVCYWKSRDSKYNEMPAFIDYSAAHHIYGIPSLEYPGHVKICYHIGNNDIDPDLRDVNASGRQNDIEILKKFVKQHFPCLEPVPSVIETCVYTSTPDEDLVLDVHPVYPNIVIGCGFSGHGFKLAPVVGQILSDLAVGKHPSFDISHNKISRFNVHKSQL